MHNYVEIYVAPAAADERLRYGDRLFRRSAAATVDVEAAPHLHSDRRGPDTACG